ncbi:MAG: peptidylprolyl isomerase [Pseudomonadota bacterium]
MTRVIRTPLCFLAAAALTGMVATAVAQETAPATTGETAAETGAETPGLATGDAPPVDADTVLITVNGVPITLGEIIQVRQTLPAELQRYPDEFLMSVLLEQMRDQQLLAEAARARDLQESRLMEIALRNQERAILADAYMADEMLRRVSEAEIQRVYQERYAGAEPIEEVSAAHILVETQEEALAIKAELDAGGDFTALASQHSLDEASNQGGALGWFARDEMAPAFAEAAFDLADGVISAPVQSAYGWHLIRLDGRRDRALPPLEEVQGEIITELSQAAQNAILAELRAAAEISQGETDVSPDSVRQDALIAD